MTTFNSSGSNLTGPFQKRAPGVQDVLGLLNYVPEPSIVIERNKGTVIGANPSFLQLTAFDLRELTGQSYAVVFPNIHLESALQDDRFPAMLRRRMREPLGVTLLVRPLDSGSSMVLVQVFAELQESVRMARLRARVMVGLTRMARLSQQESFENALGLGAEYIGKILEARNVAIYMADPHSPAFIKSVEWGEASIFPPELSASDLVRSQRIHIWRQGKRVTTELHRAGRLARMEYVAITLLGQEGKWIGLMAAADNNPPLEGTEELVELLGTNIERLLQDHLVSSNMQQMLQEKAQTLGIREVVFNNVQEGIFILSPDLEIMGMNQAAEWMLGYAEWEVSGKSFDTVLIGTESLQPGLSNALSGVPMNNTGNATLVRRNGYTFPAVVQAHPVLEGSTVTGLVVIILDASENEEIKQRTQILEQRALLGEVTAVFAHEVRNPINNIYSGLQLLEATLPSGDPNIDSVIRLQNDCLRLNHLMDSVLSFSRNTRYTFEPTDLQTLLQRILDRWQARFAKVNVGVYFQAGEKIPKVSADAKALEQVFTNLISNAVEAMSKTGGMLAIKLFPVDESPGRPQVKVSVSDSGPGIPDEIRDRIFEPFVTTKAQGTGLGLAITKRIVTAHQGSIQLNSFPGGTVFEVILPALTVEGI